MKYISIYIFVLLTFSVQVVLAQNATDISKLKKKQIRKLAENYELVSDYYNASKYYEAYLLKDSSRAEVYFRLGELYKKSRDYVKAADYYLKSYKKEGSKYPLSLFYYAQMLKSQGKYEDAIASFEKFNTKGKNPNLDKKYSKQVPAEVLGCKLGIRCRDSILRINVALLDTTINKAHVDFAPIPVDDTTLIFSSLRANAVPEFNTDSLAGIPKQQLYQANFRDSTWKYTSKLVGPFNDSTMNSCNGTYSSDSTRFYFTRCKLNWKNQMICSIYVSQFVTNQWTQPQKLSGDINDDNYSSTMPTIGKESKNEFDVLYFVSDRPGGKGGLDIWYTVYNDLKGTYSVAKNAGAKINTSEDEVTPFFNLNNHTLYFSSNGWTNVGGFDVFQSSGELNKWSTPENLGAPVNSSANDIYYIFNKERNKGFFVSNRIGGIALTSPTCCYDIYSYNYIEYFFTFAKGKVVTLLNEDDKTPIPLSEVDAQLYKIDKNGELSLIKTLNCDVKGNYQFKLEPETNYRLIYSKPDFISNSYDLSTKNVKKCDTLFKDVTLVKMVQDKPIIIKNIYFEFDKAILTASSKQILDTTILALLNSNSDLILEIGAHTDSLGSDKYNLALSEKRAESVVEYLVSKGADKKQLRYRGYGETMPLVSNSTEAGRQKNRRIEFKIIGNTTKKNKEIKYEE